MSKTTSGWHDIMGWNVNQKGQIDQKGHEKLVGLLRRQSVRSRLGLRLVKSSDDRSNTRRRGRVVGAAVDAQQPLLGQHAGWRVTSILITIITTIIVVIVIVVNVDNTAVVAIIAVAVVAIAVVIAQGKVSNKNT